MGAAFQYLMTWHSRMVLSVPCIPKDDQHCMLQEASGQAAEGAAQGLHTTDNPMYNMRRTSLSALPQPCCPD